MGGVRLAGLLACAVWGMALGHARAVQDFYDSRPIFERPFPAQRVPQGLRTLSAQECGSCHVEIYREWQQSVHAQAWTDPQFQAEMHKQPGVSWLCVNCHTPLRNQIDSLVVDLAAGDVERPRKRANRDFVPGFQHEGITCAACHVRDGAVEGSHPEVISPHAVRYNPEFRTGALCLRCHEAVHAYPGKNFICTFQTGDEWRSSSFAAGGVSCVDCHMPPVTRPLAANGVPRRGGSHSWIGSRLRKGGETAPGLWDSLAARVERAVELDPEYFPGAPAGREITWRVRVVNANAGHLLPTGDPERELRVELAAVSATGDTIARSEQVIAQKYEWHPAVRKISDNRLAPGQETWATLLVRVPAGRWRLVARAVNVRISDANADYHRLPASYPRRAEVARFILHVPAR